MLSINSIVNKSVKSDRKAKILTFFYDGIFDFLRVDKDKPLFIEDHLDRFFHSAEIMRLGIPQSREDIKSIVQDLIQLYL
jgi:branched-subunit amino acid aminotransferase/4-amino-4-deoxychorismate lyase